MTWRTGDRQPQNVYELTGLGVQPEPDHRPWPEGDRQMAMFTRPDDARLAAASVNVVQSLAGMWRHVRALPVPEVQNFVTTFPGLAADMDACVDLERAFTCPTCGQVSYRLDDVIDSFCRVCNMYAPRCETVTAHEPAEELPEDVEKIVNDGDPMVIFPDRNLDVLHQRTASGQKQFVPFTEDNENEGETWRFWLQLTGNEDALAELAAALTEHADNQVSDFPYELDLDAAVPEFEVDVLVKHSDSGYMAYENKVVGRITLSDNLLSDPQQSLYKGMIREYFVE